MLFSDSVEPQQTCTTYHTSYGFAPYDPADPERNLLRSSAAALGVALLLYFMLASAGSYLSMAVRYSMPLFSHLSTAAQTHIELLQQALIYSFSFAAAFLVYRAMIKIPFSAALPMRPVAPSVMAASLPVSLGVSVLGLWAASYVSMALEMLGLQSRIPNPSVPGDPFGMVLFLINMAVLPAILEECFFRGVVMQSLRRFGDGFALLVSSLIFSLLHIYPAQLSNAFLMGLVLGFFVLRTGSLRVSILIHFVNNVLAAVFSVLSQYLEPSRMNTGLCFLYFLYIISGILCFVYFIRRNPHFFQLRKASGTLRFRARIQTFFSSFPMVIALILIGWRIMETLPY